MVLYSQFWGIRPVAIPNFFELTNFFKSSKSNYHLYSILVLLAVICIFCLFNTRKSFSVWKVGYLVIKKKINQVHVTPAIVDFFRRSDVCSLYIPLQSVFDLTLYFNTSRCVGCLLVKLKFQPCQRFNLVRLRFIFFSLGACWYVSSIGVPSSEQHEMTPILCAHFLSPSIHVDILRVKSRTSFFISKSQGLLMVF